MTLLDDVLNGSNVTTGLVIGAGALIAWPLLSPIARPLVKSLIKAGMVAYSQAEQVYASAVEGVSDLVAEVQEERLDNSCTDQCRGEDFRGAVTRAAGCIGSADRGYSRRS